MALGCCHRKIRLTAPQEDCRGRRKFRRLISLLKTFQELKGKLRGQGCSPVVQALPCVPQFPVLILNATEPGSKMKRTQMSPHFSAMLSLRCRVSLSLGGSASALGLLSFSQRQLAQGPLDWLLLLVAAYPGFLLWLFFSSSDPSLSSNFTVRDDSQLLHVTS